jgi:hypothetical protein
MLSTGSAVGVQDAPHVAADTPGYPGDSGQ